jgi:DNA invertase Pin-like site-specific DNA recombinase
MLYAYIRVSTDTQTVENQKFAIEEYCRENSLKVNKWINEIISGKIDVRQRKLGGLIGLMKKGDMLICSEISRLGRDMLMLMSVLNECVIKGVKIIAIKGNYRLENNLTSKIFAMAYSISSELEREFISQRTKDALARKKAEGVKLGHPVGVKNKNRKLLNKESEIQTLIRDKISIAEIARIFEVDRGTVSRFVKDMNL